MPDSEMGEELCVCIRRHERVVPSEQQLREFCRGKLADFLTPRYFKFSVRFPLTATGKVDKLQLTKTIMQELKSHERSWQ